MDVDNDVMGGDDRDNVVSAESGLERGATRMQRTRQEEPSGAPTKREELIQGVARAVLPLFCIPLPVIKSELGELGLY